MADPTGRDDQGRFAAQPPPDPTPAPPAPPVPAFPTSRWGATPDQMQTFYDEVHNPATRGQALERTLQQYGILPQGVSIDQARQIAHQYAEEQANPLNQLYGPQGGGGAPAGSAPLPQYGQQPQQQYPPEYGYGDPYGAAPQQEIDPYALQQAWRADQQRMREEIRQEMTSSVQRMEQVRQAREVVNGFATQRQLTPEQTQHLLTYVGSSIDADEAAGQRIDPLGFPTYVQQKIDTLTSLAGPVAPPPAPSGMGAPPSVGQGGMPPGGEPQGRGITGSAQRALEAIQQNNASRAY